MQQILAISYYTLLEARRTRLPLLLAAALALMLALAFFVFTLLTAVVVHPFWNVEAPGLGGQLNNFMKNLAIMGGMLYVVIHGPGPLSLGGKQRNAPHVPQNKKR